jgi:hypothetical protein
MTNKRINFIQNFNRISDFTKMNKSTVFIDLISKVNNTINDFTSSKVLKNSGLVRFPKFFKNNNVICKISPYCSRGLEFTSSCVRLLSILIFVFVVFCCFCFDFVCPRSVSCVPNAAIVSKLFIQCLPLPLTFIYALFHT